MCSFHSDSILESWSNAEPLDFQKFSGLIQISLPTKSPFLAARLTALSLVGSFHFDLVIYEL